jgi:hypothetical protein
MRLVLTLAGVLAATAPASAFIHPYYVQYVHPRGGPRGKTVDVVFHGAHLASPRQVLFYRPGIVCLGLETLPPGKDGERVRAKFRIAADCPLGEHPLRLLVGQALSEAVTFWVGPFPVANEQELKLGDNDDPRHAESVPLNVTVHGELHPGDRTDRDCYRVPVKAGQRLSVEVEAVRLGTLHNGGEADTCVRVLAPDGKELARCDDSPLLVQDPHLSFVAPAGGEYVVEVSQPTYYPSSHLFYRCHIGTFARPTAVFPAGGKAGEALAFRVIGDVAGDAKQTVKLPDAPGDFDFFGGDLGDPPPSPNRLRVSPYPNVLAGPNPVAVPTLPAALNGAIDVPGATGRFKLRVEKGKAYKVAVFGRGLGHPIDPKIWLRPADAPEGPNEVEADDSTAADHDLPVWNGRWKDKRFLDPVVIFCPKKTGEYVLGVEDTRGKAGPDYVYRVEVEQTRDGVRTFLASPNVYHFQPLYRLDVPRGGRVTRNVTLAPILGNAFTGEVELEAVGLPRGVKAITPRYRYGTTTLPVQFVADADAPFTASTFELRVRPVDRSRDLLTGSFHAFALTDRRQGLAWHTAALDKLAIGVTDPAPFRLELEQPAVALARSGELLLTACVRREPGYDGPVEVGLDWVPPGVEREAPVIVPPGKTEAQLRLRAGADAAVGTHRLSITGMSGKSEVGNFLSPVGRFRTSSVFVDLMVSEPYLVATVRRSAVERGQRAEVVCDLTHAKPLPGPAAATLRRLPAGVTLVEPLPTIRPGDKQVAFTVEASRDALVGQYKDISFEVTVTENGQTVRQGAGSGTLRVDPARDTPGQKR